MFTGARLTQARELNRLTQKGLSDMVEGMSQPQLSRFEKDLAAPNDELREMLALNLNVASHFFEMPKPDSLDAISPQLRARSRLTSRDRRAALQFGATVAEQRHRLSTVVGQLEDIEFEATPSTNPAQAALMTRRQLGVGDGMPLPYVVLLLERAGVQVVGLPLQIEALDAFCVWREQTPVICLLQTHAGDRLRFSVAHELGHLVLHGLGAADLANRDIEAEADEFASEFLMPSDVIAGDLARVQTLSEFIMLKTTWGTSIKALIRKSRRLGFIDAERAVSLYKQMSARGWNRNEPGYVPLEKPRGLRRLAEVAYGPALRAHLAKDSGWSESLTDDVLGQHASSEELPHEGARRGAGSEPRPVSLDAWRSRRDR